jgi:hypothetical protein
VSSWDELRLQVTPGAGVVARSAAALLVVPAVEAHQQPALEQLLGLVRAARPGAGRALARRLAGIVASSEPEDVPDLAMFAGLGSDDVAVLVLGEVEVSTDTSDGPVALSGRDSLTWVDRILKSPTRIVVGMPGAAEPQPMPWVDLVEGVVPGTGALLEARDAAADFSSAISAPAAAGPLASGSSRTALAAPAPTPLPAPLPTGMPTDAMPASPAFDEPDAHGYGGPDAGEVAPPSDDFQVESLADVDPEPRAPLPVEPDQTAPDAQYGDAQQGDIEHGDAAQHTDLVEGVYCKRGHFTDPESQFCIVCGIGLYETKIKRKGVRPELGFLVFDDGSVFHLDHDYVLGRQPEVDEEVKTGSVRGLRLEDSGGTVSRAHAIVRLVGWNVTIADRKSQNGTLVAAKGSDQFVPVSREQPITLVPGSRIQLGQRTLVYESQRGRS